MIQGPNSFGSLLIGQLAGDALRGVLEIAPECLTAEAPMGWPFVAQRLSAVLGGQWWPKVNGVTWLLGRQCRWLIEEDSLADIRAAREVCAFLGVDQAWSVGGCARRLLKFVGPSMHREACRERLLNQISLGYHDCQPGEHTYARLWDVSGCYFNLLSRLPCLRCTIVRDGVLWHQWLPDEASRWRDVLEASRHAKVLRNALWGCALGRVEAGDCYIRGELRKIVGSSGPFRAAALLVGRSAWELCRLASIETAAVYSQTDSVITPRDVAPTAWASVGLDTVVQASGAADIRRRGVYRVGSKETYWYHEGSRFEEVAERPREPSERWYDRWLP